VKDAVGTGSQERMNDLEHVAGVDLHTGIFQEGNKKRCSKCGVEKDWADFYNDKSKKSGLMSRCKPCSSTYIKKEKTVSREEIIGKRRCRKCDEIKKHVEFATDKTRKLGIAYICKICSRKKTSKRYFEIREFRMEYSKRYASENRCKINSHKKIRKETDENYRLSEVLRTRVRNALKAKSPEKLTKTIELIGCSIVYLKRHLESQFIDGMTWDAFGHKGIHIDHIKPVRSFDLTDPEQQRKCFHFTNMQPLWAEDNYKKG